MPFSRCSNTLHSKVLEGESPPSPLSQRRSSFSAAHPASSSGPLKLPYIQLQVHVLEGVRLVLGSPGTASDALTPNSPTGGTPAAGLGASVVIAGSALSRALLTISMPTLHLCSSTCVTANSTWRLVASLGDITVKQLLLLPKTGMVVGAVAAATAVDGAEYMEVGTIVIKKPVVESVGKDMGQKSLRRQQQLFLTEQDAGLHPYRLFSPLLSIVLCRVSHFIHTPLGNQCLLFVTEATALSVTPIFIAPSPNRKLFAKMKFQFRRSKIINCNVGDELQKVSNLPRCIVLFCNYYYFLDRSWNFFECGL